MRERKNRLVILIALLLVSGFTATSLVSYFVSRSSLRSQIAQNELPQTSDNSYSEIQRDLLRPIAISSFMATDTFLRDWVVNGEQDQSRITRYLKAIQIQYNTFTSFFVSEKTKIYYHADGILKTVRPDEERDRWYFRVREMIPDYEINVDPDMANKDAMTIFVNYRVYDYDETFIGATGVGLNVHAVKKLIEKYQMDYGRNIFFVDDQGSVVLRGSSFPKKQKNIHAMGGLSDIAVEILSVQNGSFRYVHKGKTVHVNTRYIPEFGWYLLVEKTEEKAIRQILNALLVNLAVCGVITLVVVIVTSLTISFYQRRLEKMAVTDNLTGAYNRHAFDIIFDQNLKDVHRKETCISIILFDIDNFKRINDNFGHVAGDMFLQHITRIALSNIRSSDVLCRWGGEEFIILLKECTIDDAFNMAETIRAAVKETPAFYEGKEIAATISLGVAQYRAPESQESMLSRVDGALYDAKHKGRDRSGKAPA